MPESTPSLLRPLPLAAFAAAVRNADAATLIARVDELLDRAAAVQPVLRTLLPEKGRRARLERDVRAIAARWPDPATRPPLFGVPVGVKDIIAIEGLPLRAGSALPAEAFAFDEAAIVRRLREAGALVFAQTVTTEFASRAPGGTANPHDPRHTPGGSSSGSAAGVAAGIVPLALGSQTAGSVSRPAAFCGVVGFKPTYDRIPLTGVLPHAASVDTLGLFAQDLAGIALAVPAVLDGWRAGVPAPDAPSEVTVAIPDGAYLAQVDAPALAAFERTVEALAGSVRVTRVPFLDDIEEVLDRHADLMIAEFAAEHADRFERWGPIYSGSAADQVDRGRLVTPERLSYALAGREELRARVAAYLDDAGADVLVVPSALGPAPLGLHFTGDPRMNAPWTHAGVPTVSLPAGTLDGLPLGVQVVGRFGLDEELLAVAALLEPIVGARPA